MITPVSTITPAVPLLPAQPATQSNGSDSGAGSFTAMMKDFVMQANQSQVRADTAVKNLAAGKSQDIHEVMMAMEQARLSMMAVVEVRNKLVEAYQDLSKMPV
jgi:flagellar hook-basal body complex protein FliE